MTEWINRLNYGNKKAPSYIDSIRIMPSGTDSFWVVSGLLRITPEQQLNFLQRLYYDQLPVSKSSTDILKKLMLEKTGPDYKLYGKRGSYRLWGEEKYIGWFVGYVETKMDVIFLVNFIQTPNLHHPTIVEAQKKIVFNLLPDLLEDFNH